MKENLLLLFITIVAIASVYIFFTMFTRTKVSDFENESRKEQIKMCIEAGKFYSYDEHGFVICE